MKLTRRDLLRIAAGSAAGVFFTPIPWKVLDDSAIWTQNWPWIPQPSRGEATQKLSACTLCGAGCGIRARCIDGMPVSLAGVEGHPFGFGTLCAAGLAAHHLAFHPLRTWAPIRRTPGHGVIESNSLTLDQAIEAVSQRLGRNAVVAVLDRRPGRIISFRYRQWLGSLPGGLYLTPPATEFGSLAALQKCLKGSPDVGYDFEHASCIVSFGTPLFDCWGSPGRMVRLLEAKRANGTPTVIQIEHRYSRTAMFADTWLPAFPGTEKAIALSLLNLLVRDGAIGEAGKKSAAALLGGGDATTGLSLVNAFDPESVGNATGIEPAKIVSVARMMVEKKPTIVLAGGDAGAGPYDELLQRATVALNVALGSVGTPGGILTRTTSPWESMAKGTLAPPVSLTDVTDHSIDILLVDAAEDGCWLPWPVIDRKLKPVNALVVSLSPFDAGLARHADIVIPTSAPLEQWEDVPAPVDAPQTGFALSAPLMAAPEGTITAADVIRRLSLGTGAGIDGAAPLDVIKDHVKMLYDQKRGAVQTGSTRVAVKDIASADALFEQLGNGGAWFDDTKSPTPALLASLNPPYTAPPTVEENRVPGARAGKKGSIILVPCATKGTAGTGETSPVLSKLFQESTLRPFGANVFVNPVTMDDAGIKDGEAITVTTAGSSASAVAHIDATVMPGIALFPVGPDPEAINQSPGGGGSIPGCCSDNQKTWRLTPATLGRA
ncbi:MAG TPA: hypothetical protein VMG09_04885 [Bacteroidota bacterium]|nr:hypothetical protein [Bacteroidota bacterium]